MGALSASIKALGEFLFHSKEMIMAKGQLRSNKEAKKPKKPQQPVAPVGSFIPQAKTDKPTKSKP